MSKITARLRQSPNERLRYVMDYTIQLAPGENVTGTTATVTQTGGTTTALTINGIALLPANSSGVVTGFAFFASGGGDGCTYEVDFLTATTLTQELEDVVAFTIANKT